MRVLIYSGPGACRDSILHLMDLFSSFAFPARLIQTREVIEGRWMEEADLFVMPGGADLPYCRALNGQGNRNLAVFVEGGGSYLGICAGSYYAGRRVEFAKGTDLEVIGDRELSFFPGTVRGPTFPPFQYASPIGRRAVALSFEKTPVCFYHGGGSFRLASEHQNVQILAHYRDASEAAIVRCSVGKGTALLSGVHFEYNPDLMDSYDPRLVAQLKEGNAARLKMVQSFIRPARILGDL